MRYVKIYMGLLVLYTLFMGLLYYAGGASFYWRESKYAVEEFASDNITGDITETSRIEQTWLNKIGDLQKVGVMLSNYDREITGDVIIQLLDAKTGEKIAQRQVLPKEIGLNQYVWLELEPGVDTEERMRLKNARLLLVLLSESGVEGLAATALYHSKKALPEGEFTINGQSAAGSLCIASAGRETVWTGPHYLELCAALLLLFSIIYVLSVIFVIRGKREFLFSTGYAVLKYKFLLRQLVSRDFKVRYKRSVLGICWSFLHPVLLMLVQYMVFSQLFKADIENFPLYLLSGTVVFNFFNEAAGQALGAIVYNAPLITKVYVPKYLYPVTKVLSSGINFLISMVPLCFVMAVTGEPVTKAMLMLPYLMVCVILFSIGWGMLLSALMVFFRDIQFLWGVFSMLWMYLTPLFYPESILPEQSAWVLKYNPMYYYVSFIRSLVLDGMSPEPKMYALCLLYAVGAVVAGGFVFKRTQDKFVLNI